MKTPAWSYNPKIVGKICLICEHQIKFAFDQRVDDAGKVGEGAESQAIAD